MLEKQQKKQVCAANQSWRNLQRGTLLQRLHLTLTLRLEYTSGSRGRTESCDGSNMNQSLLDQGLQRRMCLPWARLETPESQGSATGELLALPLCATFFFVTVELFNMTMRLRAQMETKKPSRSKLKESCRNSLSSVS